MSYQICLFCVCMLRAFGVFPNMWLDFISMPSIFQVRYDLFS